MLLHEAIGLGPAACKVRDHVRALQALYIVGLVSVCMSKHLHSTVHGMSAALLIADWPLLQKAEVFKKCLKDEFCLSPSDGEARERNVLKDGLGQETSLQKLSSKSMGRFIG